MLGGPAASSARAQSPDAHSSVQAPSSVAGVGSSSGSMEWLVQGPGQRVPRGGLLRLADRSRPGPTGQRHRAGQRGVVGRCGGVLVGLDLGCLLAEPAAPAPALPRLQRDGPRRRIVVDGEQVDRPLLGCGDPVARRHLLDDLRHHRFHLLRRRRLPGWRLGRKRGGVAKRCGVIAGERLARRQHLHRDVHVRPGHRRPHLVGEHLARPSVRGRLDEQHRVRQRCGCRACRRLPPGQPQPDPVTEPVRQRPRRGDDGHVRGGGGTEPVCGGVGRGRGEGGVGVQVDAGGVGGGHQLGAHRRRQRGAIGRQRRGDELERVPVLSHGDELAGVGQQVVVNATRETQQQIVRRPGCVRVVHSGLLVRVRTRPWPIGGNATARPTR